jgi:antitoxin CptB
VATEIRAELGRLRWRCRRGMRELDELLTRYIDERYATAPEAEQAAFRSLVDAEDSALYAYCLGSLPPPSPEVSELLVRITAPAGPHG